MKLNESWYIILNIYFNIVYDIYNNCINLLIKIFSFLKLYNASYAPPFQPEISSSKQSKENVMSRVFKRRNIEYTEEFSAYLSIPLSDENTDPLEWWKVNKVQFPNLSQMAQDYLAIPVKMVIWSWDLWSFQSSDIKDRTEKTAVLCGLMIDI